MSAEPSLLHRIRRRLARALAPADSGESQLIGAGGCLEAAASFIAWNQVPGDYLEFGVWRGDSFRKAWSALHRHREIVAGQGFEGEDFRQWLQTPPRFFAFDSFQGLPGGAADRHVDYAPGDYSCSLDGFRDNMLAAGLDWERVVTVPGYYEDSLSPATRESLDLSQAALVMIDCDLYESTVPVLEFITPLLVQGSVLVFDDWFRYRGSPRRGEQRACHEWLRQHPEIQLIEHWRQGPQVLSFIVNFEHADQEPAIRGAL